MAATTEKAVFKCDACEKEHPWSAKIAGKVGRCKCGNRMTVPPQPLERGHPAQIPLDSEPNPSDLYDFAEPSTHRTDALPTLPEAVRRPHAVAVAKAEPVLESDPRAFNPSTLPPMRKGLKQDEPAPVAPQSVWLYLVAPIVLIVAGLVLTPVGAALKPEGWTHIADGAVQAYVGLLAELIFVLVAMFAVSAVGGISFDEPLWRVALKLCAVATLPGPVGQLVQNSIGEVGGSIAGNFTQIAMYFGIFMLLFRQAMQDTVVCVFAIFIIRTLVAYAIFRFEGAAKGSEF